MDNQERPINNTPLPTVDPEVLAIASDLVANAKGGVVIYHDGGNISWNAFGCSPFEAIGMAQQFLFTMQGQILGHMLMGGGPSPTNENEREPNPNPS